MTEGFRATGGCRCNTNPVRYEYDKEPFEVHYCLCTDCTDVNGGALAILAVVERDAFRVTQGEDKIKNFDTKETVHRKFCGDCGCHMFFEVGAFPDHILVHVPTLDRESEVGGKPDRWVFTDSKLELVQIPEDGLPQYPGWENSPVAS